MSRPSNTSFVSVSRSEFYLLALGSWIAGIALFGVLFALLYRFMHVMPAIAYGVGFFGFSLAMFCPYSIWQRTRGFQQTLGRFVTIWGLASILIGALQVVLQVFTHR